MTDFESRNAKLKDEIDSPKGEGTNLQGENDSLKSAVTDCRDAAVQMQKVLDRSTRLRTTASRSRNGGRRSERPEKPLGSADQRLSPTASSERDSLD